MTVFADTSALVLRYVDEPGRSSQVLGSGPLVVSQLVRVEVPSAFWRKHRMGELAGEDAAVLCAAFEADYHGPEASLALVAVDLGASLLDDAARLVAVHGLRAADAIQLASALVARRAAPEVDAFAAFDDALRRAAAAEAFTLRPAPA